MITMLLWREGDFSVALTGALADAVATFNGVSITSGGNTATLELAEAITPVPERFLSEINGEYWFPTAAEANERTLASLRATLRSELATRTLNVGAGDFFGIAPVFAAASLSLRLEPNTQGFELEARAVLDVNAELKVTGYGTVDADDDAQMALRVVVTEDGIKAALELLIDALPNQGFALSGLDMSGLSFVGLSAAIENLRPLRLPLPEWMPQIRFAGGGDISLAIEENGGITLSTSQDIQVQANGTKIATIADFAVEKADGVVTVKGTLTGEGAVPLDQPFEFGGAPFPVRVRGLLAEVTVALATDTLTVSWDFASLGVEASNDPSTRIAVALTLVTKVNVTTGVTTWEISGARLLDLGGDVDLVIFDDDPELLGGMVRLRLGVLAKTAEALTTLADRLARLLAAIIDYAARAAGPVAGLLSELAEVLGGLLADGLAALLAGLDAVGDAVTLELRLDATTFRPLQLIVAPRFAAAQSLKKSLKIRGSLLRLDADAKYRPALIVDFIHHWQGLALLRDPDKAETPKLTVSTDLWLGAESGQAGTIPVQKTDDPLIKVTATAKENKADTIVLAALQRGHGRFFQTFETAREKETAYNDITFIMVGAITDLKALGADDVAFSIDATGLKEKITALMPQGPQTAGTTALDKITQFVRIDEFKFTDTTPPDFKGTLTLTVVLPGEGDFEIPVKLEVGFDIETLHLALDAEDDVTVTGPKVEKSLYGFDLVITPAADMTTPDDEGPLFTATFANGDLRLELAGGARAELTYDQLSGDGGTLRFDVSDFAIGRGGFDLTATVRKDRPIRLGGLDQPFRFTRGSIRIEGGTLLGGTISGHGPMPPALIGEANAEIDLVFGSRNGNLALIAANARLEREGEPLYSTGTRFRIVLDALGLGFVEPAAGPTQFYFQLWGSASFEPGLGEFDGGLLENLKSVAIKLEGAPLTSDGRELIKHISFVVELDPPLQESLFEIFKFEIRGIAFYPSSDAWPDNPPAIGIAGQIAFLEAGDVVSSEITFHELLMTIPEPGGDVPLPRIRADGLSMLLRIGSVAQVEATALAVDGSIPSMYAPVALPADVTAQGFLASGRIDVVGLGAFGGALGVLELRRAVQTKHAMFVYGQAEKLTERIDTPIGPLFIREAGFGVGKNYTLTALAGADAARSPRELVRTLDELSKIQGNLTNFDAWTPQFDKDALTLALRGMISITASPSSTSASYDASGERDLSNPLLMDVVLALRTDLTFFVNVRGWLATNYNDWLTSSSTAAFKSRPTLRGYLYFSVPRKEFLARFLSDPTGIIGRHPELPKELVQAIEGVRFSATLYIRPGLYHTELGWPYELGFELGKPTDNFYLSLSGGLVFRIEDATMLYGVAFRAVGLLQFAGEIGNANFGASAVARADFLLGARFIAYLAPLNPKDTLFFGEVYLGLTLEFSVAIWMSFKIFRKRFTLRIGFSINLTISVSAEVVLSGRGLGAKVYAAVGVRGFGRTLSVGVGFSFGDGELTRARARVARFMELGLGVDTPRAETLLAPAPSAEPARRDRAARADDDLNIGAPPAPPLAPPIDPIDVVPVKGRLIEATEFWAILSFTGKDATGNDLYLMQFVPRDFSDGSVGQDHATFFAEPWEKVPEPVPHDRTVPDYQFQLDAAVDGVSHLAPELGPDRDGYTLQAVGDGDEHALFSNLLRKVGESENGALDLNTLMAECFLAHPDFDPAGDPMDPTVDAYGEPMPILHGAPAAPEDKNPRKARREQATRFEASTMMALDASADTEKMQAAKRDASLITEEKRSALINKIGETALDMAERARMRTREPNEQRLTRPVGLDAVDFGLTFLVNAKALDALFDARTGADKFTLKKRALRIDGMGAKSWDYLDCPVTLLNPPREAFSKIEPRLDDPRVKPSEDGFQLSWNLEPAFGSVSEAGLSGDPDTRLAYYEIERSFTGAEIAMNASFRCKSGTVMTFGKDGGNSTTTRSRATLHLTDDLSRGGVPEDLRALLFGTPLPGDRSATAVWEAAFGQAAEVQIIYTVKACDVLGTETGLRQLCHTVQRPVLGVTPPLSVELALDYRGDLPRFGQAARPVLQLSVIYADAAAYEAARNQPMLLRVRAHELRGGGQYGADAVDDAKARPGQADIDAKRADLDRDLYLIPDPEGALEVVLGVPEGTDGTGMPPSQAYSVAKAPNGEAEADPTVALYEALRLPQGQAPAETPRTCRVFLQSFAAEQDEAAVQNTGYAEPSAWITVETLLRATTPSKVSGEAPTEFAAVVELLEAPFTLPFLALEQTQIEREAGRLELVYPQIDATLATLSDNQAARVTVRRLDPDRRAAIRLAFNANGARLPEMDETALTPLVAGYDIFSLDPARLRLRAQSAASLSDVVAAEAQKRSTVTVLPRSLAGTSPSQLPDTRSIEARYPSDAARTIPENMAGRRRAPWYSAAESLVAFPGRTLRRSLVPAPDEATISELLAERDVTEVQVTLFALPGELAGLSETAFGIAPDLELPEDSPLHTFLPEGVLKPAAGKPSVQAAELRALMQGLVVNIPDEAADRYQTWRNNGSPDSLSGAFRVGVRFAATDTLNQTTTADIIADLATSMHPVLADTLDSLAYEWLDEGNEVSGAVYRAYEAVQEPVPPLETPGLDAFLDARAPGPDPFGWGVLRTMGLAAGIRVYDIDRASFLSGTELFAHVNRVFTAMLTRYAGLQALGHPFAELVNLPDDFIGISAFDGRTETVAEDTKRIREGGTSILQIGLRPHAGQLHNGRSPVRYLKVTIADEDGSLPANVTVTFPSDLGAAIIDTVGMPLADGAGAARFATGSAVEDVFSAEPKPVLSDMAEIQTARLQRLAPGETAFFIRVAVVDLDPTQWNFDGFRTALAAKLPEGLALSDWFDAPNDAGQAVFETFAPLDPPLLQRLLDMPRLGPADATSLERFLAWLPPRHHPENQPIFDNAAFAARFGAWSERFLQHGLAITDTQKEPPQDVSIAFAALTTEESYARTPDENGRVEMVMIDETRLGREVMFAIRPYGRYVSIAQAAKGDGERAITLNGGLNDRWQDQVVAISIPRSKPLDPPAILSAARAETDSKRGTAGVELVVARTPDQIVSTTNLRAERALQGGWTGLELRAQYGPTDIAKQLLGADFDPFEGFDPDDFGETEAGPGEMDVLDSGDLTRLGKRVPDAWRGAIRYELTGAPPFFDLTALVHQSAGVVVSGVTAMALPKPGTVLRLPPDEDDPTDVRHHEPAEAPTWRFDYTEGEDQAVVTFDFPMVRNIDIMPDVDILAWTQEGDTLPVDASRVAAVYRLPDAETSYRISLLSTDQSAATPVIEVLPAKKADDTKSLYLPTLLAERFAAVDDGVGVTRQSDPQWNWRLGFSAKTPSIPPEDPPVLDPSGFSDDAQFSAVPADFGGGAVWKTWAPTRSFKFTIAVENPDVTELLAALEPFRDFDCVAVMIAALSDTPEKGDEIAGCIPLGLFPNVSALLEAGEEPEIGPYEMPDGLDDGISALDARKSLAFVEALNDEEDKREARRLLSALRTRAARTYATGKAGFAAYYVETAYSALIDGLSPPYAHFRMLRYAKAGGLSEAEIQALIAKFQTLLNDEATDPYTATTALGILGTVAAMAPEVSVPLAVGTAAPTVTGVMPADEGPYFAGVHWLPGTAEQTALPAGDVMRPIVERAFQTRLLGGASLQMTAFRDADSTGGRLFELALEEAET